MRKGNEEENIRMEGLTEEECREFQKILLRLVKGYKEKRAEDSDEEWLYERLREELPESNEEELYTASREMVKSIQEYDKNLKELNDTCAAGGTKEKWFADKIAEASQGVAINEYGDYLETLDLTLSNANAQMQRTVTTKSGDVSLCMNLDGFIAEQHQVNSFNRKAALEKLPYRAEVCVPLPGETYGKNSFDVVIKDINTGKRINQYQFKYGKDAEATIRLLKQGNYNNQRFVVPAEQVEAVKEAFPNKTVESFIGGNGDISVKSDPLTKQAVKEMQQDVQQEKKIPTVDWNSYNTKSLALKIGQEAGLAGIQAAVVSTGFEMARKVMSGEKIEADETVELALKTGTDTGLKTATAGALKVASEKGIIRVIPKGTPASTLVTMASVGIENVKILMKVASGELTMSEALEKMGRTTVAMVSGMASVGTGALIGAASLSWIPIVGPIVGGLAGGMIAYTAGSKIGEKVFDVANKVKNTAKEFCKKRWNKAKGAFEKARNFLRI